MWQRAGRAPCFLNCQASHRTPLLLLTGADPTSVMDCALLGWSGAMDFNANFWPLNSCPCSEELIFMCTCPCCVSHAPLNLKLMVDKNAEVWDRAEEKGWSFEVVRLEAGEEEGAGEEEMDRISRR